MQNVIKIFSGIFSDGVEYSLIINEDGQFETCVDGDIFEKHDTIESSLDFIKKYSEEIVSNHKK